jgi:glycosyltransferase involved in cell wall biosynthesis
MHICLLCYRGNPYCGGQGIYLYHLSRALSRIGHRVTLIVGPPYPENTPWAREVRIPNHQFWGKRSRFLPSGDPLSILQPLNFFEFASSRLGYFPEILAFSLRAVRVFRDLHRRDPFDVVHDVETLGYGLLLIRKGGLPTVSTVHHPLHHDLAAHLRQSRSWVERYYNVVFFPLLMQGFVARRVDGMITSSKVGREELVRGFRVPPGRIHLVTTGIDLETFSPDPKVIRSRGEILFVGNAQDPRKGIRYLLEALRELPAHFRLKVVDEGEPRKTYAPGLVRAMGLGARVTFTGKVPLNELVQWYREAAVLVMPSLFEGFGLPAAEAMACETPVIVTRAGSLPEVVGEDEEGGRIVQPGNPKALAQAIRCICENPELARNLGVRGRRRALRLFSWEATAKGTAEVYERVLEEARHGARLRAAS